MAEIEYRWTKNDKPIRISEFATNLGFNLKLLEYNGIQENKMDWVNKKLHIYLKPGRKIGFYLCR